MVTQDRVAATDDVHLLIAILPADLQNAARRLPSETLMEIVMDLGRPAEARFPDKAVMLVERPIGHEDLAGVLERVGEFTEDNRAGIERTLHRISAIRNRKGDVVGLTLRAGRAVLGTIDILRDLLESRRNLLILGRPGIGKTTLLREAARVLADDFGTGSPLHPIKSNTSAQMRRLLQNVFNVMQGLDDAEVKDAVREAEHAIQRVLNEDVEVALAPRRPMVRKMQHRMIARYHLEAHSHGKEPLRHLVIHPR